MNTPKPGEDLSALFRSLRPDDKIFQATLTVAAHEAEQRWPLFRAIAPKKPALTPALSDEDKLRWSHQEKPGTGERKPALSLPGLDDKLTLSLSKMSGLPRRSADAPAQAMPALPRKPELALPRRASTPPMTESAGSPDMLLSKPMPVEEPVVEVELVVSGLFGKSHDTPSAVAVDDSLANIFGRLRHKEEKEVVSKPAAKKSSFMGRLGKK